MQLRALLDQRVARGGVDGSVEIDVGFDHRLHIAAARCTPALFDQARVDQRTPRRGQPRGECVERTTHLVDPGNPFGVERRHQQAAAGRVEQQAVFFQQPQRLQYRLARHREALGQVFLRDAGAGRERAEIGRAHV